MMPRRRVLTGLSGAVAASLGAKAALAQVGTIKPQAGDALIVVDVQNCFTPGGSLAVPRGDEVVPIINRIAKAFRWVVLTQDWHTPGHASFASAHAGKKPFDVTKMPYGNQVLWPDHCVQGTEGASLHKDLSVPHAQLVIRKGYNPAVDSYSAFIEADRKSKTGLNAWLKAKSIKRVFCCGLATDFCVAWSAVDAAREGFDTVVIEDACRAIDLGGSLAKAWTDMAQAGVRRAGAGALAA